ncbi:hypothetical protein PG987_004264 [Apiospora arundinis]
MFFSPNTALREQFPPWPVPYTSHNPIFGVGGATAAISRLTRPSSSSSLAGWSNDVLVAFGLLANPERCCYCRSRRRGRTISRSNKPSRGNRWPASGPAYLLIIEQPSMRASRTLLLLMPLALGVGRTTFFRLTGTGAERRAIPLCPDLTYGAAATTTTGSQRNTTIIIAAAVFNQHSNLRSFQLAGDWLLLALVAKTGYRGLS